MVRVTEQAASALEELLAENGAPLEAAVRLTPEAGGTMGMIIQEPQDGDEVISRNEAPLLIVDGAVAPGLSEMVVDVRGAGDDHHQTPGGFMLRPKHPDE